jgi:hypothetical protein
VGWLSKTTRTLQLSKIQDVRIDQSLGQRLLGVGDMAIEISGEGWRRTTLTTHNRLPRTSSPPRKNSPYYKHRRMQEVLTVLRLRDSP